MKKLITLFLALALCLSLGSVCAAAETVVNWEDMAAAAAEADPNGELTPVLAVGESQLCWMWIPTCMVEQDVSDEEYIFCYTNEDGTWVAACYTLETEEGSTLESLAAEFENTDFATMNGAPVLAVRDADNDTGTFIFLTTDGIAICFVFSPISDADFQSVGQFMLGSIQFLDAE